MTRRLLDLPRELLFAIVAQFEIQGDTAKPSHRLDLSTLLAIARCNREFHSIATPFLYRCAVLMDMLQTVAPNYNLEHDTIRMDMGFPNILQLATDHLNDPLPKEERARTPIQDQKWPTPFLLSACLVGDDRLVKSLAAAANSLTIPTITTSPSPAQTYLSARFLFSSSCPDSHCPALFRLSGHQDEFHYEVTDTSNILPPSHNHTYSTALHLAAQHGRINTVHLLIALLRGGGQEGEEPGPLPDLRLRHLQPIKSPDSKFTWSGFPLPGWLTPMLHASVKDCYYPLADALDSPVPLACVCPSRHLRPQLSVCGIREWPRATPLMVSIANGHTDIAIALVAAGAEWQLPPMPSSAGSMSTNGVSPVHMMVANGMVDLMVWLLSHQQSALAEGGVPFLDFLDDDGNPASHYITFAPPAQKDRLAHLLRSLGATFYTTKDSTIALSLHIEVTKQILCVSRHVEQAFRRLRDLGGFDNDDDQVASQNNDPLCQSTRLVPPSCILRRPHCKGSVWFWVPRTILRRFQVCHRTPLAVFRRKLGARHEGKGSIINMEDEYSLRHEMQALAALQGRWMEFTVDNLTAVVEELDYNDVLDY